MATTVAREPAGPRPAGRRPDPAPGDPGDRDVGGRLVWRVRLATVCVALSAMALSQSPGLLVPDTKLDLYVDPVAFLGRALQLWEPEGFAGQVQNQAYGYLFPMGPFFALGQLTGVPMWLVQRFWWALLLCTAFLGVVLLTRRLRIGTPATALAAGLLYALAPRMISVLGSVSVEVLPMALAPWVVLPLVGAQSRGSARRAACLSGLAVFCVGGVNAVATAAVLLLPALYLVTRPPGNFRRRLLLWWGAAVALATCWWVVPLLLLGRYSPPFLDFIETAGATTGPTDLGSALRGTSHWVAYLATPTGPYWPAGWSLARDAIPVAGTVVLAAVGLLALTRRDLPERTWLVFGLLTGLVLVGLGHVGTVQGLFAGPVHDALDGALAPLRNVHKFDPVLRLPLALAVAHLLGVLLRTAGRDRPAVAKRPAWTATTGASRVVLVVLGLALVATASPALKNRMAPPGGFEGLPAYWQQAADHLSDAQPSGRALLVPGSSFATYAWGRTNDEPLQPLADSPWEVRNAIPLTPAAHIRTLDAVEERLARGEGSAGLARFLARAGISHLVLRNDLDTSQAGSTRAELVRQALRDSPGIRRVAGLGPDFPADVPTEGLVYDAGLQTPHPAVEIFAVDDAAPRAWTAPLSDVVTVHGGPDAVLELEDRGLIGDRPTVLAGDLGEGGGATMVSDALIRRERTFGRVTWAESAGLSADDPLRLSGVVPDYPVPSLEQAQSVVRYGGGTPSASSSASDPDSAGGARPGASPWAALDGDPRTAWRPADGVQAAGPSWWRLDTDEPFQASHVTVTMASGERPGRLRLVTDSGGFDVSLRDTDEPQRLPLPRGASSSLTISPASAPDEQGEPFALAEIELPGVSVTRSVVTPAATGRVDVFAFDAAAPGHSGCLVREDGPRCTAALVAGAEEPMALDRIFTVPHAAEYDLAVTAVPRPGPELDALLSRARGGDVEVTASSSAVDDPRASAAAAMDGDPATAWLAAPDDLRPTLELSWPEPRTIDSIRLVTRPGLPAAVATAVSLEAGGLPRLLSLDDDGRARFAPITTDRLAVTLALPLELDSFDPYSRGIDRLGVGISELHVGGENPAPDADAPVTIPCGSGPVVSVDGERRETSARTTIGRLTELDPLRLEICGGEASAQLGSGEHRLVATGTDVLTVRSATVTRAPGGPDGIAEERQAADALLWDAEHRRVRVAERSGATLLVVPENTNPGWTASLDGQALPAVAVDGWQQGYLLPPGAPGTVHLDFGPGTAYRTALAAGAGAVALLVVLAVLPARAARREPAGRGRRSPPAALVVATAVGGLAMVGGVVGVAVLVTLHVLALGAGRRRHQALGATAATALGLVGALLLTVPDGTSAVRDVLALVAVAAVVAGSLPELRHVLRGRLGRVAAPRTGPSPAP